MTATRIKPIQTRAYGRLFRSRHEARVATFLTEAGIPWEYEPEGFELPSGRYLPDFKTGIGWIECKPVEPNEREKRLASELSLSLNENIMFFTPKTFEAARENYKTKTKKLREAIVHKLNDKRRALSKVLDNIYDLKTTALKREELLKNLVLDRGYGTSVLPKDHKYGTGVFLNNIGELNLPNFMGLSRSHSHKELLDNLTTEWYDDSSEGLRCRAHDGISPYQEVMMRRILEEAYTDNKCYMPFVLIGLDKVFHTMDALKAFNAANKALSARFEYNEAPL